MLLKMKVSFFKAKTTKREINIHQSCACSKFYCYNNLCLNVLQMSFRLPNRAILFLAVPFGRRILKCGECGQQFIVHTTHKEYTLALYRSNTRQENMRNRE